MEAVLARRPEKQKTPTRAADVAGSASLAGPEGAEAGIPLFLAGAAVRRKAVEASGGDEHEREADAVADGLFGHAATCGCGGTCPRCRAARALLQRKAVDAAAPAPAAGPRFLHGLGTGRTLEAGSRAFFEARLGAELGDVRVHTGRAAATSARALGAHAYAAGRDIVFGEGMYAPGTDAGDRLLAHELTHVLQQRQGAAGGVQRRVAGDIRQQSITPEWARDLTDEEMLDQLRILREHLRAVAGSAEEAGARENLRVLEEDQNRRTAEAAGLTAPPTGAQVLRPGGLPLDGGFQLTPVPDVPAEVAAALPEGRLVTLPPGADVGLGPSAPVSPAGRALDVGLEGSEVLGSAYAGARIPINAALMSEGFAAAGDTAVGMVAIPRQLLNPLSPNFRMFDPAAPLDVWGHTAMYVRQGGRITVVRGFNPQMGTVSSFMDVARGGEDIVSGARGVPAEISADAYLFRATASRSIEWPVSPQAAAELAAGAPPTGPVLPGAGEPPLYTADPAAFAAAHPELGPVGCTGSNCGLWAARQVEPTIGGPIGRPGSPPIMDLGPGGTTVPGAARQGRLIGMLDEAAAGAEVLPMGAVVGRMPGYLRYLKWGGRVFLVVGIASVPLEVYLARPEERTRTAVGATAGFAGGLAFGAAAGLVCGPGALVCSVVLGIGFGIAGAMGTRAVAEGMYDLANPSGGTAVTDPAEQRRIMEMANRAGPCPSCHRAVTPAAPPFHFPTMGTPGGAGGGGSRLTDAELRQIIDWVQANPSR